MFRQKLFSIQLGIEYSCGIFNLYLKASVIVFKSMQNKEICILYLFVFEHYDCTLHINTYLEQCL